MSMARPKRSTETEQITWYAELHLVEGIDRIRNSRFPIPDRTAIISELMDKALYGAVPRCENDKRKREE